MENDQKISFIDLVNIIKYYYIFQSHDTDLFQGLFPSLFNLVLRHQNDLPKASMPPHIEP